MAVNLDLILRCFAGLVVLPATCFGVWWFFGSESMGRYDISLIEKINKFGEENILSVSNNIATISTADGSLTMKFSVSETSSAEQNKTNFEFKFTSTSGDQEVEIEGQMKSWICSIAGNIEEGKTLNKEQVEKMKESFGIKDGTEKLTENHKKSMKKLVRNCSYYGAPKNPEPDNSVLKRTVTVDTVQMDGENGKLKFDKKIERFFVSSSPTVVSESQKPNSE